MGSAASSTSLNTVSLSQQGVEGASQITVSGEPSRGDEADGFARGRQISLAGHGRQCAKITGVLRATVVVTR
jgi:hypothetical protein